MDAHPDQLKKFLQVTQRAIDYTNKNSKEGVQILCKSNPSICSDDGALNTNVQEQELQIPLYSNLTPGKPMFSADTKTWQATEQLLLDSQTIDKAPDPAKSFTNKLITGC